MSRVGQLPVPVPEGVQVTIQGSLVKVQGPKGKLQREFHHDMSIQHKGDQLLVIRPTDNRNHRALHGLTRALLANMVTGVSQGFQKRLIMEGTGYRAEQQGEDLVLNVGLSHPVRFSPPPGISFVVEKGYRRFTVSGADKEVVGEIAAQIRRVRPPEPYKGKGIRYEGEVVRRKAGKSGKVG